MRNKLVLIIATLALAIGFVGSRAHASPDLSSPMAAAKSFTMAMLNGDVQGVQASIVATPEQSKAMSAMTQFMGTRKKLLDAATAKWGADGEKIEMQHSNDSKPEEQMKKLDESEVKIDGDTATITPKIGQPQHLKKVDGQWKIDLSQSKNIDQMVKAAEMMPTVEGVYSEMATEVQADKYKTVDEAQKAMMSKMQAAMMSKMQKQGGMAPGGGGAAGGGGK